MAYARHQLGLMLDDDTLDIAANTNIMTIGSTSVLSQDAADDGAWRFVDAQDLLNARCVAYAFDDQLADETSRTVTATINADGLVQITGQGTDGAFEVRPSADNAAFGFATAGQAAVLSGGNYVLTATLPWRRGTITEHLTLRWAADGLDHTVPRWDTYEVQDVPTLLRTSTTDDDSANRLACLEARMVAAIDPDPETGTYWGQCWAYLDADGYATLAWHVDVAGSGFAWAADALGLAYRLGFTGAETAVIGADDVTRLTASHRPSTLLWADYHGPLRALVDDRGEATSGRTGDVFGADRGTGLRYALTVYVRGPMAEPDAFGRVHHQVDHYLHEWLSRATRGRRCSVIQRWGDSRRWLRPRLARGDQPAEDVRFTTADREGRIVCRIAAQQATEHSEEYLNDAVESYMQVDLILAHIPTEPGPRSAT